MRKCFVEVSIKFYSSLNREKSVTGIAFALWYGLKYCSQNSIKKLLNS